MDILFPIPQLNLLLLRRQVTCPDCASLDLRPLAYGYGMEGGCEVSPEYPKIICEDCGSRFMNNQEIEASLDDSLDDQFVEQYLMDEILLNDTTPSSFYTKYIALQFIKDPKNLSYLRLVLEDDLQSRLTYHINNIKYT